MPDQLTSAGLQVKTLQEIIDDVTANLQSVYGTDINAAQNSPDGQMINIYAQAASDLRELLLVVYNSFAITNAYGTILDQRLALNGIFRREGSFTTTNVEIVTDRAMTLAGLDAAINDADGVGFTIADDAGNQFILAETQIIPSGGIYTFVFRAKAIGVVETIPNTITNQVTVVLGVTGVNNPDVAILVGVSEETDIELKLRHARSFSLAATGPVDAIQAALTAISSVTDSYVPENTSNAEVDDVPAHSIWPIVEGGSGEEIGLAIYSKKSPGCGMKGSETQTVDRPNGDTFTARFDRPIYEDLYIEFTIIPRVEGISFDTDLLKTQLASALSYKLAQSASIGDIVVAMLEISPLGVLTDVGVSNDGITFTDILDPSTFQHKFSVSPTRIEISA